MAVKGAASIRSIVGTDLDDVLAHEAGVGAYDGGAGLDKLVFGDAATRGVTVNLRKGTLVDAAGQKAKLANIEIVQGTAFDDRIDGSDNTDYLIGGGGNDRLNGGKGDDELYGMDGDDRMTGGDGMDYFVGGAGADRMTGGKGFDTADYSDDGAQAGIVVNLAKGKVTDGFGAVDTVSAIERFVGTSFDDVMTGNKQDNVFSGGAGADKLAGGKGKDTLDGGAGADVIDGGDGNDMLTGGEGDDQLFGGKGVDAADYRTDGGESGISVDLTAGLVWDSWGNVDTLKDIEIVKGTDFADKIVGSDHTDFLDGWGGDDYLFGGKGADELYGADGDDHLEGGEGSDYMDGGLGDDQLVGGESWDFFVARMDEGDDVVLDFDGTDLIDMRNTGFTSFEQIAKLLGYEETELGGGVMLRLGEGSMFILNIKAIDAENFVF